MEFLPFILNLCWTYLLVAYQYGPPAVLAQGTSLDVTNYGAVGDGLTDDSRAFELAWQAGCQIVTDQVKITVPSRRFLVYPIQLAGPCKSRVTFEILGTIVAQPRTAWADQGLEEWLCFYKVDGLTVVGYGQGLIDGQGDSWWGQVGEARPTALRFSNCNNLQVIGLRHINSPKNHVSITQCNVATISGLHMIAPATSPNTDGIDISASTNLNINNCTMETGDDCIAINSGTSDVTISDITCGPGHGISIGSLGRSGGFEQVERINVTNCNFIGSLNGVNIKTWQGGSGFARNISFSQINFTAADHPVVINQFYCPHQSCNNDTSAVQISDIFYSGLRGTSICKNATVSLLCSDTVPCMNIIMSDVDIQSADMVTPTTSQCMNAHGQAQNIFHPDMSCLQI